MGESKFTGGVIEFLLYSLLVVIISVLTLGLAFPWLYCMFKKWEIHNTVINGRRLYFDGTGTGLFGNYIKWFLLTIITLGIYRFWWYIGMKKWEVKHTHFEDELN